MDTFKHLIEGRNAIRAYINKLDELKYQICVNDPKNEKEEFRTLKESIENTIRSVKFEDYTAIIIEPRKHKALSFVVRNIFENLDWRWNVIIFHGTENLNWLEGILETDLADLRPRITIRNLGVKDLATSTEYSRILSSREFTEQIPTETFLIFQTDSMINPSQKHRIYKFLKYDYVGAPSWPGMGGIVGNGGFCLRKRSKMLEIIRRTPPYMGQYEDLYFSIGTPSVSVFKPSLEVAKEFSVEQFFYPTPLAVHKVWHYLPKEQVDALIKECEGLDTLISLQGVES